MPRTPFSSPSPSSAITTKSSPSIRSLLVLVALVNLAWSLYQIPLNRVIERRLCRDFYLDADPSAIGHDGSVPEELCKLDGIQQDLGSMMGLMETGWVAGDFVMTIPLVLLADRYGHAQVLRLNLVPRVIVLCWTLAVGYFDHALPLPALALGPLSSVLGGDCVFNSIVYSLVSSATHDDVQRATFFGQVNAVSAIFAAQLGPALASGTMSILLWLPLCAGVVLLLAAVPVISGLPASNTGSHRRQHDQESIAPLLPQDLPYRPDPTLSITSFKESVSGRISSVFKVITSYPPNFTLLLASFFFTSLASSDTKLMAQYISKRYGWKFTSVGYLLSGKAVFNFFLLYLIIPTILRRRRSQSSPLSSFQSRRLSDPDVFTIQDHKVADGYNISYAQTCLIFSVLGVVAIAMATTIWTLVPSLLLYAMGIALPMFTYSLLKSPSLLPDPSGPGMSAAGDATVVVSEAQIFSIVMLVKTLLPRTCLHRLPSFRRIPIMANQQLPPPRRRGDHLFERWGVKLHEDSNGIISSGLLPMFPTVDGPYGLAEDLWWTHKRALQEAATHAHPMPKSIPKPSGVQLDELFCTERWQQVALHGLRTWELPSLNQGIIGTSYWQEVFMTDLSIMQLSNISVTVEQFPDIDLIHVDESKWHIAFRRSRWYDLRGVVLEKDVNGRPTNTRDWSVDDNGLWGELRVAIEMANRMLHHVLYGDWISAMLEGSTDPIPNVLPLSGNRMPQRMVSPGEAGIGLKQPDQRIANRIWHQIELLSQWIIWSFFDPRDLDKYGSSGQPGGVTAGYCSSAQLRTVMEKPLNPSALPHPHDPEVFTDIKINTMLLEALLSISNTPEEVASKHTTRLQLALVIVHEFMHALQQARVYVSTCSGGWQYEPEQSLLDAVTIIGPVNVFVPDSDFLSRAGPAFTIAQSWLDDPTSQSFWDSHVAVYGKSALKAEPVVRTKQRISRGNHVRMYHARGHVQPSLLRHQPIVPNQMQRFRLEEEQTFQYMEFRKKLWKSLRPWYKQSYRIWQKTPYSFLRLRRLIDQFRQAVLQRNRADAEAAVKEYSSYLNELAFDLSTPYNLTPAPPGTAPFWFFEFHHHPALWPFCMLEVMMHASLPYDWSISVGKNAAPPSAPTATTSKVSLPNRWFPSQHARAAGAFFKYPLFWTSLDEPPNVSLARPDVTDPSEIYLPMVCREFARPHGTLTWPSPKSLTSLYKARWDMLFATENERIKQPMKKYPISKRLWQALMDQYKQLLRQNQRLGENNSNGQWLDFDFVFPPYDENDEFVVLEKFSRPMSFTRWIMTGFSAPDWFLQGHADPDKLTVMSKPAPAPADAPEVWQRWWPVHPYVDVDMDVDMMDG
ncbi:hypothetical protein NEUTE2DRAFT_160160 [Neurospora tetrasperma FGSC 2509]|nr:hypothetical protein NEUTE2DRAFT_160160 [Neurospora tetrasperma FGSC 2509]